MRKQNYVTAAVEAQCASFGNSGFMAIPIIVGILGTTSVPFLMMNLLVDSVFFGKLLIIILTIHEAGFSRAIFGKTIKSLITNPMVMSMVLGLVYSSAGLPQITPIDRSLEILGQAATSCALFAIGASLAGNSAERISVVLWLSSCKLILHPSLAAIFALIILRHQS